MERTIDDTKEIMKALSYGVAVSDIVAIANVTAEEVQSIASEHAAEIEALKEYHSKMEG